MKPFRVVAGLDLSPAQSDKKALAEARKSARPILKEWLRRIELAVMGGELSPLDYLMAKELCNYPSSNEGRCYAGQERLGAAVGATARTARSSLKRLREREFVYCKRGGPGHTASWTFCVNGKPTMRPPCRLAAIRILTGCVRSSRSSSARVAQDDLFCQCEPGHARPCSTAG
jgi:hypothetical protein